MPRRPARPPHLRLRRRPRGRQHRPSDMPVPMARHRVAPPRHPPWRTRQSSSRKRRGGVCHSNSRKHRSSGRRVGSRWRRRSRAKASRRELAVINHCGDCELQRPKHRGACTVWRTARHISVDYHTRTHSPTLVLTVRREHVFMGVHTPHSASQPVHKRWGTDHGVSCSELIS